MKKLTVWVVLLKGGYDGDEVWTYVRQDQAEEKRDELHKEFSSGEFSVTLFKSVINSEVASQEIA